MKRSIIPLIIILLGQTIYAQQKFNLISNNKAGAVYYWKIHNMLTPFAK